MLITVTLFCITNNGADNLSTGEIALVASQYDQITLIFGNIIDRTILSTAESALAR